MADVVELSVVPDTHKLKEFDEAKSEGDVVENEFIEHCLDAGWTLIDLNGKSRNIRNVPVAKNRKKDIVLPDYIFSKQPYGSATTMPPMVAEVKSKMPVRSDGLYWLDDWRWDYFEEVCNHFGFAGLMVWKKKPHEETNLDNFYCVSREKAKYSIEDYSAGGPDRLGRPTKCYKWDPNIFIPLRDFLYGELVSPIRHSFELKTNGKWMEV